MSFIAHKILAHIEPAGSHMCNVIRALTAKKHNAWV